MTRIPGRLPAYVTDRLGYMLRLLSDIMIQVELQFDRSLDGERLARAFDLLLDAHPVLGCRFVAHRQRPYWERLGKGERESFSSARSEEEYESFKTGSLDAATGPQVKACLLPATGGDRLLMKVSHVVSDAGGVKEIACIASDIYSRLAGNPDYKPEPNLEGSRSIMQVMGRVPWHAYPGIFINYLRSAWSSLVPLETHSLSLEDGPRRQLIFVRRRIPADRVSRLAGYGRERGATLNDIMTAAFFRGLAAAGQWDGKTELRLGTTVDLRRYLPAEKGEGICNLSAIENVCLGTDPGKDFKATLAKVTAVTNSRKAGWIGLSEYVTLVPSIGNLPYSWSEKLFNRGMVAGLSRGLLSVAFTNLGPLNPGDVTFGARPRDAWILPPPGLPPRFVAGLSGYEGTLTLSAGVYPLSMKKVTVDEFFDSVLAELPE